MTQAQRVVVVTGASRGIGAAIAQDLSQHGYWVWMVARDAGALHRVASSIRDQGGRADFVPFDITDIDNAPKVFERISQETGHLDGLVNNAGTTRRGSLTEISPEDYDGVMRVNVRSLIFFTQAALPFISHDGAIVNMASLNSFNVLRGAGLYAASKAAVLQLTRAFAIDVADRGIRVNAVAPGFIHTDFNHALWERPEIREWVETNTPLGRLGRPQDVVGAVRFLLSPDSSFVTGSVLVLDGGFLPSRLWPL